MDIRKDALENLSTVARFFTYAQEKEQAPPDKTISRIRSLLPQERFGASIDALEGLLKGNVAGLKRYGMNTIRSLSALVEFASQEKANIPGLLMAFEKHFGLVESKNQHAWEPFNHFINYFIMLALVTISTTSIFVAKVLPSFRELFSAINTPLPAFTLQLMENQWLLLLCIFILGFLLLIGLVINYRIKKQYAVFQPFAKFIYRIPLINQVGASYSYLVFLQTLSVLSAGGLNNQKAFDLAKQQAHFTAYPEKIYQSAIAAIAAADQLACQEQEIATHIRNTEAKLFSQLIDLRERSTLLIQVAFGVLIGALIIAMYLPIFMLGSVV